MTARDRDQAARLVTPFAQAQAEMRGDDPEYAAGRADLDLDGAARLPLGDGEVVISVAPNGQRLTTICP